MTAAGYAPAAILSLLAGVWLDRRGRRSMPIACQLAVRDEVPRIFVANRHSGDSPLLRWLEVSFARDQRWVRYAAAQAVLAAWWG